MRSVLVLFVFLAVSCQERNDSSVASGTEQASEESSSKVKQSYFAGFRLQPLQVDDSDEATGDTAMEQQSAMGTGQATQPIKVVVKVVIKGNKPYSLLVKEVTSVADLNNPTAEEIPEDDRMLLLMMSDNDKIGHKGSRKYQAGHIEDDEERNYELHWFSGTWKQNRNRGDSKARGPISDTSVARFVVRVGDVKYANVDDSFAEESVFDNRLVLSAEEIAEKYFATETDDDLLEHRNYENLSSEDQCGELLKPYIGYNVYRIDRPDCQDDDESTDDGFLLVRASVGVAEHLARSGQNIKCRVAEVNGLKLESAMHTSDSEDEMDSEDESDAEDDSQGAGDGNTIFASSGSCLDKLIDIQAKTVGRPQDEGNRNFLDIEVTKDDGESERVWLEDNRIAEDNAFSEALLAKYKEDADEEIGDPEPPTDNPLP